ncbi:MAG: hypothetical protein PHI93_11765 [Kiritimatiellae bacterium]|nr:hypothetical protein [Kiritimatiellia bacterium]
MMNLGVFGSQQNCTFGPVVKLAGEDLTGMEGRLAKLNSSGEAILPTDMADICPFIVGEGAADEAQATLIPMSSAQSMRVLLKGTCNAGDRLCPADMSTSADAGKAQALPATGDTYGCFAVAEEDGVDAQLVKFRYVGHQVTVVS